MSRAGRIACLCLAPFGTGAVAQAEPEAQTGTPPQRIDILIDTEPAPDLPPECETDQDAAQVSGEIVVCGTRSGTENRLYDKETAERRHAERTKGRMPMDVNLDFGIPMVGAGISMKGCFIPPCPTPMPILIDIEALPEAPPGSDADRVARGLAPRSRRVGADGSVEIAGPLRQANAEELGLPPVPPEPVDQAPVNPTGSASPAPEPSD